MKNRSPINHRTHLIFYSSLFCALIVSTVWIAIANEPRHAIKSEEEIKVEMISRIAPAPEGSILEKEKAIMISRIQSY